MGAVDDGVRHCACTRLPLCDGRTPRADSQRRRLRLEFRRDRHHGNYNHRLSRIRQQRRAEFVRARKAMQYSASIDDVARIFKEGNSGGYATTG